MKKQDENLLLDNQLCFALYASSRALTAAYRPFLDELGITYPQYIVMLVLWENHMEKETATVKHLGQRLKLDSGTLTPLLKRMENAGLLKRTRSKKDEREVLIDLTPKGRKLKAEACTIPESLVEQSKYTMDEIIDLRDSLQKFLKSMTE